MNTHALPLMRLFLLVFLFTAVGCPQNQQPSTGAASAPAINGQADATPTDYRSQMAFSVDLLDPVTGLPVPADIETLKPTILREVERVTYEPTLRQVLNDPSIQSTTWFKQFADNLDDALVALENAITAHHVPGTPLFRVYVLRSLETDSNDDAQIILQAIRNEYMRRTMQLVNASIEEQLQLAMRARDEAEDAVSASTAQLKRHLQNNPISSNNVERARLNTLETESLQQQLRSAEARREAAIKKVSELLQRPNGFLGYAVQEEVPPQKAR